MTTRGGVRLFFKTNLVGGGGGGDRLDVKVSLMNLFYPLPVNFNFYIFIT